MGPPDAQGRAGGRLGGHVAAGTRWAGWHTGLDSIFPGCESAGGRVHGWFGARTAGRGCGASAAGSAVLTSPGLTQRPGLSQRRFLPGGERAPRPSRPSSSSWQILRWPLHAIVRVGEVSLSSRAGGGRPGAGSAHVPGVCATDAGVARGLRQPMGSPTSGGRQACTCCAWPSDSRPALPFGPGRSLPVTSEGGMWGWRGPSHHHSLGLPRARSPATPVALGV